MVSRLSQIQARFQQKQMQEKEEKLLRLYENQQQRAFDKVNRNSAGSNASATSTTSISQGGKVRQMFDERRQKAGIDRSYPLEPLKNSKNGHLRGNSLDRYKNEINSQTIIKTTGIKKDISNNKTKKPTGTKTVVKAYSNNNNNNSVGNGNYELYRNSNNQSLVINKTYKQKDLEHLLNNFHVNDSIDNEEFPDVDIDGFDEPSTKSKMYSPLKEKQIKEGNISKNLDNQKLITKNNSSSDTQTLVKKKVLKSVNGTTRSDINSSITPVTNSIRNTKSEITPTSMSKKISTDTLRAPSTARPSSKILGRGPTSAVVRDDLDECQYCNRRFAPDRLATHQDICAKTGKKKRKTYDATKHRLEGTELEPFVRKTSKVPQTKSQQRQQPKKNSWRQKHEEFISAIRAAKMAQAHVAAGGKLSDLPPPPPSTNPDYVQCPHCGRRFNETAAARHIPKCATYEFNKPKQQTKNTLNKTYR